MLSGASQIKATSISFCTYIFIFEIALSIFCGNLTFAQKESNNERDSDEIKAVVLKDMKPNSFYEHKNSPITGFSIELTKAIAQKAKISVDYIVVNDWKEAEQALISGEADFCPEMAINEYRSRAFLFSQPVETFFISICIRSENREIKDTTSLKGKKVGVIRASQAFQLIRNIPGIQIEEFNSFQDAIYDLLAGHIDAFVGPDNVINSISEEAGLQKAIKVLMPPINENKRAFAFPKNKQNLYDQLIPVINQFVSSPDYQVIYRRWFLPPMSYWTVRRTLIWSSVLFLLIFFIIAMVYYRSIIKMNKQLKQNVDDKEKALQKLEESLNRINDINVELELAKEKAEENDHLKTAFLQNLSHEIRTPMNAIMGFADLIPMNLNNKDKLEYFSSIISQRSNDLLEIINEILEISKIETGQMSLIIDECSVGSILDEVHKLFLEYRKKIKKEHIAFKINNLCNPTGQTIKTDGVKLKQILINLINNAFKFTDHGEVEVGCELKDKNYINFYVKDTGIGIPYAKQSFIFERFSQLEYAPDRATGGTGLGLSIVKGLVELLNGEIWVESEPGKGSEFVFKIPLSIREKKSDSKESSVSLLKTDRSTIKKSAENNGVILIVEDDPFNAEYLSEVLKEQGMPFFLATNGAETLDIISKQTINLILMDILLPDFNGDELTRMIKKDKPNIVIIAQTAYAFDADRERFIKAGCDDFISKPIIRDELFLMINTYLAR
jgi:signal transduction histidine kinase